MTHTLHSSAQLNHRYTRSKQHAVRIQEMLTKF